jgi:Na+/alanine symporter
MIGGDRREIGAGLVFTVFGVVVVTYAQSYPLGTATKMGPGYFPTLLGIALILLGLIGVFQGWRRAERVQISAVPVLPLIFVLSGVLVFAYLINDYGLIPAVVAMVLLGCYERLRRRPFEVLAICIAMVALAVGIFYYGVQLPLDLW